MRRLIVNADDFGWTRGVNSGIIRGFREGIITSATLMANAAAFDDAVECAKVNPTLGVGCHLVLVGGTSVSPVKSISSLADGEGNLPATLSLLTAKLSAGSIQPEHIARELRAQIKKIVSAGIEPSHLDSHKHTHTHPQVMEQVARVAEEFGIRRVRKPFEDIGSLLASALRSGPGSWRQSALAVAAHAAAPKFRKITRSHGLRTPDHFWGVGETGALNAKAILSVIRSMPEGVSELMCHPGEYDQELARSATRLKKERERELEALTDRNVRVAIKEHNIELTDYRGLN